MTERVAILLDGGFVRVMLDKKHGHFPSVSEIASLCTDILKSPRLDGVQLFRVYYYGSPPASGKATNPVDGSEIELGTTTSAVKNQSLLDQLELRPDFAVRRGTAIFTGWKLKLDALEELVKTKRPFRPKDIVPDIKQKGVDLKIGLDIAWISTRQIADIIVLVSGDSDMVPAMKFARKEGLKVYLETLGKSVKRELCAHADYVF